MSNKKKKNNIENINEKELQEVQKNYIKELENNVEYSLQVDPDNKYNMSESQKKFIENYVQFKNINTAAELSHIDMNQALEFFTAYNTQTEIRRINRALYHLQFSHKLLELDDLGGYLSSLLTDENVPLANQLRTKDKLKVVEMIIEINKLKKQGVEDPSEIIYKDLEVEVKNLSIKTIQQLLESSSKKSKIDYDRDTVLTVEEKDYLNTLSSKELLDLIESTNKKGD